MLKEDTEDAAYLRDNFRWYIVPNINPDGYVHTWTKVTNHTQGSKRLTSMVELLGKNGGV